MKRVIEGGREALLAVLQARRDEVQDARYASDRQPEKTRLQGFIQGLDFAYHAVEDWQVPEPPKTWLYGLTADEWFQLASVGTESEVPPCCGNVSAIREQLQALATCQASYDGWMQAALGKQLLDMLGEEGDGGHELNDEASFPLLARVVAGIRAQEAALHAEQARDVLASVNPASPSPPATS